MQYIKHYIDNDYHFHYYTKQRLCQEILDYRDFLCHIFYTNLVHGWFWVENMSGE